MMLAGKRKKLRIGEVKMKLKFKYRSIVLTDNVKYDTENRRRIGKAKKYFPKSKKILKNRLILLETKKRVLTC